MKNPDINNLTMKMRTLNSYYYLTATIIYIYIDEFYLILFIFYFVINIKEQELGCEQ